MTVLDEKLYPLFVLFVIPLFQQNPVKLNRN